MATLLKNQGTQSTNAYDTTNPYDSTLTVTVEGINYVIGPNATLSLADNGVAEKVKAFINSANLGYNDSRDRDTTGTDYGGKE